MSTCKSQLINKLKSIKYKKQFFSYLSSQVFDLLSSFSPTFYLCFLFLLFLLFIISLKMFICIFLPDINLITY